MFDKAFELDNFLIRMHLVDPCIPTISTNESERPILDSLQTLHVGFSNETHCRVAQAIVGLMYVLYINSLALEVRDYFRSEGKAVMDIFHVYIVYNLIVKNFLCQSLQWIRKELCHFDFLKVNGRNSIMERQCILSPNRLQLLLQLQVMF